MAYKALAKEADARASAADFEAIMAGAQALMREVAVDAIELVRLMATATEIRPDPGVYFLVSGEEVVYVGQSENVMFRMVGHSEKEFQTVRMIRAAVPQRRDRLERLFIQFLTPKYNVGIR